MYYVDLLTVHSLRTARMSTQKISKLDTISLQFVRCRKKTVIQIQILPITFIISLWDSFGGNFLDFIFIWFYFIYFLLQKQQINKVFKSFSFPFEHYFISKFSQVVHRCERGSLNWITSIYARKYDNCAQKWFARCVCMCVPFGKYVFCFLVFMGRISEIGNRSHASSHIDKLSRAEQSHVIFFLRLQKDKVVT